MHRGGKGVALPVLEDCPLVAVSDSGQASWAVLLEGVQLEAAADSKVEVPQGG